MVAQNASHTNVWFFPFLSRVDAPFTGPTVRAREQDSSVEIEVQHRCNRYHLCLLVSDFQRMDESSRSRTSPIYDENESPGTPWTLFTSDGDGDAVGASQNLMKASVCFRKDVVDEIRLRSNQEGCHRNHDGTENQWQIRESSSADGRHVRRGSGERYTRSTMLLVLLSLVITSGGFNMQLKGRSVDVAATYRHFKKKQLCFMTTGDDSGSDGRYYEDDMFGEDLDTGAVVIEDLSWRVEKMRLEEQNKQRFLKSQPRFLPYDECRRWVQALGRWKTEEDWRQWISMGEKRNAYIPSKPDEYYGRLGQW